MPILQAANPFASRPATAAEVLLSHHEAQHVIDAWQARIVSFHPDNDGPADQMLEPCHAM